VSKADTGTFSGLLQIMGLASAIGCEIHLIYPDTRHNMLSLLNGIYQPRPGMIVSTDCPLESILIMWTDISGTNGHTQRKRGKASYKSHAIQTFAKYF
jgi:Mg2+/citrate symporter